MYNLINLILSKRNRMIANQMKPTINFETNFINTFQSVISEDLKEFNQHLLDTQVKYVRDFLSKDKISSPINNPNNTTVHQNEKYI